jgi:hypothetical protein
MVWKCRLHSGDFMIGYRRNKEQPQFGTGHIIHKNYKHLMHFYPEGDRLC